MKEWDEIPDIDLFSDGGAEPNPGIGGFGVIMSYKGKRKEFFKGYKLTTNNRMELMGVIFGLMQLKTKSNVEVYTDSRYVVDGITKGWAQKWKLNNWKRDKNHKAINIDLWDQLLNLIQEHTVKFNWVKGHDGHPENERCDYLANLGINSKELLEDDGYKPQGVNEDISEDSNDSDSSAKTEKEGDPCRKCNTTVIKKITKKKNPKSGQTYYFDYYLLCPSCHTMYFTEDAKKEFSLEKNDLFNAEFNL